MKPIRKHLTLFLALALAIIIVFGGLSIQQFITLRQAHSSFENYYAFRGCQKLLEKTDTSGTCRLSDGKIIKLVKFNNKWYLSGDLPLCPFNICL
ncbi:hypothetical protein M1403_01790 [Patescibacteria group bacterium]|nr:hypothetical protein [Patescibacteria group bacterium]